MNTYPCYYFLAYLNYFRSRDDDDDDNNGYIFCFRQMWDIRKKGCIFGYKGHSTTVNSLKFSPDGQWIASGGEDNYVKVRSP